MSRLFKVISRNKKYLLLVVGVGFFLSLLPLHSAQASFEDCSWTNPIACFSAVINALKNLPISIPTLVIVVPLFVITAVLGTISTILSQIMIIFVRATMSIGVTPANQEIVRIGWELSRDIVNLLFILILVFIGLATILRLQTYQAQKTLPLLIIIALLVNFSGVLVGFVVDLGNLITNFFLSYTANFSMLGHTLADIGENILNMITAEGATIFSEASGLILQVVVALFYFLIMILILFVVLLLFFTRVVILWILAILAPIAFASYILPATRKFWNQWWQQLIQWSIIGIPISFFLFLSGKLLENLSVAGGDPFSGLTQNPSIVQSLSVVPSLDVFLADILGKVAALAMLAVGVMLSMQMAPAGAQGVINFGKRAGIGIGKWAGRQTAGRLLATETGKKWMTNLEKTKLGLPETREEWKKAGWGKKIVGAITAPGVYPARWGLRKMATAGLQYGAAQPQEVEKRIAEIQKKFGKDYKRAAATYANLGATDYQGKIAMAHYLTRTKGGKGFTKLSDEQQREAVKLVAKYDTGRLDDIVKHVPELIDDTRNRDPRDIELAKLIQNTLVSDGAKIDPTKGKYLDDDVQDVAEENKKMGVTMTNQELLRKAAYKKAVDAMKNVDLETANPALMDNTEFKQAVARWKPWSFIRKIAEEWGADMIDKLQDTAEETGLESTARTNPSFIKAAYSSQGNMFMRNWKNPRNPATTFNKREATDFVTNALKPQTTLPPNLSSGEDVIVENWAQGRYNDPSNVIRTPAQLTKFRNDARDEYTRQYRPAVFKQIHSNEEQAWLERQARTIYGGDITRAYNDRIQQITYRLQQEKSLPTLTPKPTTGELKNFQLISEGKKNVKGFNATTLRKVQGALRVSHFSIKKQEDEIAKKALELRQKRATATPAEIAALENEITTIESDLRTSQTRESNLKMQENNIKSRLHP